MRKESASAAQASTCRWPAAARLCTAPTVLKPKQELTCTRRGSQRRCRQYSSGVDMQVAGNGPTLHSTYCTMPGSYAEMTCSRIKSQRPRHRLQHAGGRHWPKPCTAPTVLKPKQELTCTKTESAPMPPILQRCRHVDGRQRPDPAQHLRCSNHNQS